LWIGAKAVEVLSIAMKDKNWKVRQAVAKALGNVGGAKAVKVLSIAMGDEDSMD